MNEWMDGTINVVKVITSYYVTMVTDTQGLADQAAKVVKVTYKDCKPLILTIAQAIEAKSFAPPMTPPMSLFLRDIDVGDAQG